MGNVPGKLDEQGINTINANVPNANTSSNSTHTNSTSTNSGSSHVRNTRSSTISSFTGNSTRSSRQRRATSLVGSFINGATGRSRSDTAAINKNSTKKKNPKERDLLKEEHDKKLVVKYYENVDGGYLAPYGCHHREKLDYDADVVRKLIIDRKLAPFYIPLEDFDTNWTDQEIIKIFDSLTLHQAYIQDPEEFDDIPLGNDIEDYDEIISLVSMDQSLSKRDQKKLKSMIFKARLYRRRINWQEMENEIYFNGKLEAKNKNLPSDDLKLALYKYNGMECPICFLYFPGPMNISRCCLQPICTECFVQIKRHDPHFSHDEQNSEQQEDDPHLLISEPARCPYCATPNFGITYTPPIDRCTGIHGYAPKSYVSKGNQQGKTATETDAEHPTVTSDEDDNTSPSANVEPPSRRISVSANDPSVVTSDMIRPDWESRLNKARLRLARKSANATAIHMSNRLVERRNINNDNAKDLEEEMIKHAIRLSLSDGN
ncbi:Sip5p SCDLUD_002646 [Saccharomycodes ludwigii]|uniref:Sip5p n=1 Tax=Saccharomycodes ludwigii TaxID=36035 RepID=UPI001E8B34C9|nr:hypothetical protein SCDLUD_002646 [Saccharomycodes ludwigii]KAH3901163.1 hypothetical protein SCDLUD_002646 [Saccharomycodes ludwigii]